MTAKKAPTRPARKAVNVAEYATGIIGGNRATLGRAITLVESRRPEDQLAAQELLEQLLPRTGKALRLGISGVPGVGKSTFIEAFGSLLTSRGHRVAVLAVDPTSGVTGGSILGDKTRMEKLSQDAAAFIRPSPSGGALGGVAHRTREAMLLCEAAGYDFILVETVGVGQSETLVAEMVDLLLLLMLPGAGDELQGIKRGILEVADLLVVNKADGDNLPRAQRARAELESALRILRHPDEPPVLLCSALKGTGLPELLEQISGVGSKAKASGRFEAKRRTQRVRWMWDRVEAELLGALHAHPKVQAQLKTLTADVEGGETAPTLAAQRLLEAFHAKKK